MYMLSLRLRRPKRHEGGVISQTRPQLQRLSKDIYLKVMNIRPVMMHHSPSSTHSLNGSRGQPQSRLVLVAF
jgi:hypothetical protein